MRVWFARFADDPSGRMPQAEKRRVRAEVRAWVRASLVRACGGRPVTVWRDGRGKPFASCDGRPVFVSWSHSDGTAVLAASWDAPVGVDVERVRDRRNLPELAASCLTPVELAHWRRDPTAHRFTRLWVRKEALLKARGEGFPALLDQVCTLRGPVRDLAAPPGYHAAVATDRDHPPYDEGLTRA
ncbi:4'-phosphopantetheinyl transferase family protein [Streptomyces sp. NPDC018610]|uniref:4'-phosphopantetheinyl transferase family protein n=1 Tax=Streptomyces sp. NPDC018610 TaxID=3365049 RepID=UPI00379FC857